MILRALVRKASRFSFFGRAPGVATSVRRGFTAWMRKSADVRGDEIACYEYEAVDAGILVNDWSLTLIRWPKVWSPGARGIGAQSANLSA